MNEIPEIPKFLGCDRIMDNYELDLTGFKKNEYKEGYLFARKGWEEDISREAEDRFRFATDRYVLLEAALSYDKERKPFVRYTENGGLSHLGIAGVVIKELSEKWGLSPRDINLHQSHHGEETQLIYWKDSNIAVYALGGGFIDINPEEKVITLKGISKALGPEQGSPVGMHICAIKPIRDYLKENGIEGYKFKVEGLEGIKEKDLERLVEIFSNTKENKVTLFYMTRRVLEEGENYFSRDHYELGEAVGILLKNRKH